MNMKELVRQTRSYRRFQESHAVPMEVLEDLVDLARLSPSGRNLQPLKFMPCNDRDWNARIFPELAWAGYLPDWPGPVAGERPSAYILVLGDQNLTREFGADPGIALPEHPPGRRRPGAGRLHHLVGERDRLPQVLGMPAHLEILLVIALGRPGEEVRLEPVGPDGDVK